MLKTTQISTEIDLTLYQYRGADNCSNIKRFFSAQCIVANSLVMQRFELSYIRKGQQSAVLVIERADRITYCGPRPK